MAYDNILNALGKTQNPYQSQMSDIQTRTDNFRMAEELSNQGTSIKDVLGQIDDLKKKVEALESPKSEVNREIFAVMEKAVEDNPSVVEARKRMADAKAAVIMEQCMKNPAFREAYERYKETVNREYVDSHETVKKKKTDEKTE